MPNCCAAVFLKSPTVSEGEQIISALEPSRLLTKTLIARPPLLPPNAGAKCDYDLAVLVVVELLATRDPLTFCLDASLNMLYLFETWVFRSCVCEFVVWSLYCSTILFAVSKAGCSPCFVGLLPIFRGSEGIEIKLEVFFVSSCCPPLPLLCGNCARRKVSSRSCCGEFEFEDKILCPTGLEADRTILCDVFYFDDRVV